MEKKAEPPVIDLLGEDIMPEEEEMQKKEDNQESSAESSAEDADHEEETTPAVNGMQSSATRQSAYNEFDLLGDLSAPATQPIGSNNATVQNDDIMDLLGGLDTADSSAATSRTTNQSLGKNYHSSLCCLYICCKTFYWLIFTQYILHSLASIACQWTTAFRHYRLSL